MFGSAYSLAWQTSTVALQWLQAQQQTSEQTSSGIASLACSAHQLSGLLCPADTANQNEQHLKQHNHLPGRLAQRQSTALQAQQQTRNSFFAHQIVASYTL